jgi:phosphatidylinositol 4-phosphatase
MSLLTSPSPGNASNDTVPVDETGNRVKFSEETEVKVMTPVALEEFLAVDRSPSPLSVASVASSFSSEVSAAPVAKVLATRLSFWNKSPRKNSTKDFDVESPLVTEEEVHPLDSLIHEDMPEPQEVLERIIESAAPSPATISEKYTELEAKILRQTVKEYAKGEMYFAYDFGTTMRTHCRNSPHCAGLRYNAFLAT